MQSIGEFFELLYLRVKVAFYNWKEHRLIRRLCPEFNKIDKALCAHENPYRIPKAFPYGETPISTFKAIADRWNITSQDTLIELGCGRGRGAFFLSHYTGCTAKGIDWTPSFISHAQNIARQFPNLDLTFSCGDMKKADLLSATVIYLYGTCLSDTAIQDLSSKFKTLPPTTKIITVSYPLPGLAVQDQFVGSFPWGEADVYLQLSLCSIVRKIEPASRRKPAGSLPFI